MATDETMWATVEIPAVWKLGCVRIRYRRTCIKHKRNSYWAWVAEYAEKVQE